LTDIFQLFVTENKKCAAEATHKKHTAPIVAKQKIPINPNEQKDSEHVFLSNKNTAHWGTIF